MQTITPFTATFDELTKTFSTGFIDVKDAKRLRLFVQDIASDEVNFYEYRVYIKASKPDGIAEEPPPVVAYGYKYACGKPSADSYIPASEIFDRSEHLGADHIEIVAENSWTGSPFELNFYLLKES